MNRNDIHGLPTVLPPETMLEKFDSVIQPMFGLKKNLIYRNENLQKTRDLLLPKLISGEIDLESFEDKTLLAA